jgi:signal transduction histidine kinase
LTKPNIIIFDEAEKSPIAEAIWLQLAGTEVNLSVFRDYSEYEPSETPKIILIDINFYNKNNKIIDNLKKNSHLLVVTEPDTPPDCLFLRSKGADFVVRLDELNNPEFLTILKHSMRYTEGLAKENQKQIEQRYFEEALSMSPDAMIIFDNDKRVLYASDHYRRVYKNFNNILFRGLHVEEAFKLMAAEQNITPQDPQYTIAKDFWLSLEGSAEIELKNGQTLKVTARRLPESSGTSVTTTNITRYREQQSVLEKQSEQLGELLRAEQEASAIQKQFISMVSHEFKTPLTIIDGNAQILSRRAEDITKELIEKRSKTIRSAVSRLINLMDGVLSSSMLDSGQLSFQPHPFDLRSLIIELTSEQTDLSPELKIKTDLDKLPDLINLDKEMMTLIMSNLLSNAVKFSGESPHIIVKANTKGQELQLEFQDYGIGIPEAEQEKIFERFYRGSNTSGITGTGIGLDLVQQLVQIQNGSIILESIETKGSRFLLTFPYDEVTI